MNEASPRTAQAQCSDLPHCENDLDLKAAEIRVVEKYFDDGCDDGVKAVKQTTVSAPAELRGTCTRTSRSVAGLGMLSPYNI